MQNPSQPPPLQQPRQVPDSGGNGIIWVLVGGIVILAVALFFYLPKRKSNTPQETLAPKVAPNNGINQLTGTPPEKSAAVDEYMKDNSTRDSTTLFLAAIAAQSVNRPREAMFLCFAAKLRMQFDYERFGLGKSNGNNLETYLEYLSFSARQAINPLAVQNPELFSEVVRLLEKWEIVPADDSQYPKDLYGTPKIPKEQWPSVAKTAKDSFLNDYAYKQEKMFADSKTLEAMQFMQGFNNGTIPNNPENKQKYEEYRKMIEPLLKKD